MHTRRDALKLMTVSLGACVLPTIGFSNQQIPNRTPRKVMGVDQVGGKLVCLLKLNPSDEWPRSIVTDFEHLPAIMQEYEIEHCVVDLPPEILQAIKFAKTFPDRVTVSRWLSVSQLKCKDTSVDGRVTKACGNLILCSENGYQYACASRQWFSNRYLPKQAQELPALYEMAGFIHFLKATNQLSM